MSTSITCSNDSLLMYVHSYIKKVTAVMALTLALNSMCLDYETHEFND